MKRGTQGVIGILRFSTTKDKFHQQVMAFGHEFFKWRVERVGAQYCQLAYCALQLGSGG